MHVHKEHMGRMIALLVNPVNQATSNWDKQKNLASKWNLVSIQIILVAFNKFRVVQENMGKMIELLVETVRLATFNPANQKIPVSEQELDITRTYQEAQSKYPAHQDDTEH